MCISWNLWWRCLIARTSKICLDWHQKSDFELNSNLRLRHSCNQNMENIVTWGQNMSANIEEFACISVGGLFRWCAPYICTSDDDGQKHVATQTVTSLNKFKSHSSLSSLHWSSPSSSCMLSILHPYIMYKYSTPLVLFTLKEYGLIFQNEFIMML